MLFHVRNSPHNRELSSQNDNHTEIGKTCTGFRTLLLRLIVGWTLASPRSFLEIQTPGVCLAATAKSLQSCPTLCDPIDVSPPGSPHPWGSPGKNTGAGCHFLLQCMKVKSLSRVQLLVTPWTAAHQAPPSMRFSRQEYWSGVPLPSPWGLS